MCSDSRARATAHCEAGELRPVSVGQSAGNDLSSQQASQQTAASSLAGLRNVWLRLGRPPPLMLGNLPQLYVTSLTNHTSTTSFGGDTRQLGDGA